MYVQSFLGAKVQCMDDYKKPSIRDKPDQFIIHVGTNDLNSEISSKSIAQIDSRSCNVPEKSNDLFLTLY